MAMHQSIVDSWGDDKIGHSSLTTATTESSWGMDVRAGCHVELSHSQYGYKALEELAALDLREMSTTFPLKVDLPKSRHGIFLLTHSSEGTKLIDRYPDDSETLSRAGLLRLLEVDTPRDVLEYIEEAKRSGAAVMRTRREVAYAPSHHHHWPGLFAEDIAIETDTTSKEMVIAKHASRSRPFDLHFRSKLDLTEGPSVAQYIYMDERQEDVSLLTSRGLRTLGNITTATLDVVFGYTSLNRDIALGVDFHAKAQGKKVQGLDGQPSERASMGYAYAYKTRPTLW
jgi:hypothetical protein